MPSSSAEGGMEIAPKRGPGDSYRSVTERLSSYPRPANRWGAGTPVRGPVPGGSILRSRHQNLEFSIARAHRSFFGRARVAPVEMPPSTSRVWPLM